MDSVDVDVASNITCYQDRVALAETNDCLGNGVISWLGLLDADRVQHVLLLQVP